MISRRQDPKSESKDDADHESEEDYLKGHWEGLGNHAGDRREVSRRRKTEVPLYHPAEVIEVLDVDGIVKMILRRVGLGDCRVQLGLLSEPGLYDVARNQVGEDEGECQYAEKNEHSESEAPEKEPQQVQERSNGTGR